jgi:lipopolysaccharide export system protein LptA
MIRKTELPCLIVLIVLCGALFFSPPPVFAQDILQGLKGKGGPIEITSDRLDAYNEKKMVVFSGNVVATQQDKTIYADTLNIFYKKEPGSQPKPQAKKKPETAGGELDRIEAVGNVRIVQLNRIVTGEKAVYFQNEQKIIVTGDPVLKEGENVIKGDRVVVLLDENKGIVESSKQKRVTAVINPPEHEKDKTKKK